MTHLAVASMSGGKDSVATTHGGRQQDFIRQAPPEVCSSLYGLCE
jgi:hypothetical protein